LLLEGREYVKIKLLYRISCHLIFRTNKTNLPIPLQWTIFSQKYHSVPKTSSGAMNEEHAALTQAVARTVPDLVLTFSLHLFDNEPILPVSIGDWRLISGSLDLQEPGILAKLLNRNGSFCSFPQFAEQTGE
jgi:hypothetical protein